MWLLNQCQATDLGDGGRLEMIGNEGLFKSGKRGSPLLKRWMVRAVARRVIAVKSKTTMNCEGTLEKR
jgi:hypothetical protein